MSFYEHDISNFLLSIHDREVTTFIPTDYFFFLQTLRAITVEDLSIEESNAEQNQNNTQDPLVSTHFPFGSFVDRISIITR